MPGQVSKSTVDQI